MNNKARIDSYIPSASEALKKSKIAVDGKIDSSYRGQISSFGAAVAIGSFKQAVAFFASDAKNGESKISRSKLIVAIDYLLSLAEKKNDAEIRTANVIQSEILSITDAKELKITENKYMDAAVALKIAMGLFDMGKATNDKKEE